MSVVTTAQTEVGSLSDLAYQQCINPACRATFSVGQTQFACPECGDLLDVVYDWDRLPVPRRLSEFEAKWSDRLDPLELLGRLAVPRAAPLRAPRDDRDDRRGADAAAGRRQGRPVRRDGARPPAAPVRGDEPLGELQGQRHDRRVHPRPDGQGAAGRLRQHGQHLGGAGGLLLGDRPRLPRDHLHRLGQDRLRQAGAGARPRRPDDPDRRRLRRRDAAGPPGGRPPGHLPDELDQPVPPRRAEGDHVPGARGPRLGAPRLDRRARRQPRQFERLRQGVHRAEAPGPDRPGPPPGGDQRHRRPDARAAGRPPRPDLARRPARHGR